MPMIRWLNESLEECLSVVLLALIVALVSANVLARYVFSASLSWGEELVGWLFIWFIWIAVSYVFRQDKHIEIAFLKEQLPEAIQRYLTLVVRLIVVAFLVTISLYCIQLMLNPMVRYQVSVVLQMPMPLYYASAPAGALLSAFRIMQHCWLAWRLPRTSLEGGAL